MTHETKKLIETIVAQEWAKIIGGKLTITKSFIETEHGDFIREHEKEIIEAIQEKEAAWEAEIQRAKAEMAAARKAKAEKEAALKQVTSIDSPEEQKKVDYHAERIIIDRGYYDYCDDSFFVAHKSLIWDRYLEMYREREAQKEAMRRDRLDKQAKKECKIDSYTLREIEGL